MLAIDWLHFSPWSAIAGGAMIGLAAGLMMLINGRILGVSGILGGLFWAKSGWRFAFLAGLLLCPFLYDYLFGLPAVEISLETGQLLLAGVLVGFGSRLGSGCTSGHGVCGLSRGSKRSLFAVACFMGSAMLTLFVSRYIL